MSAPASWRDRIKVHEAADLFPMMSDDELRELGDDLALLFGLQVPAVRVERGDKRFRCLIVGPADFCRLQEGSDALLVENADNLHRV